MIIRIEDAPKIKRISIDISFEDDGTNTTTIINQPIQNTQNSKKDEYSFDKDIALDLDNDFGSITRDVVVPPNINVGERQPKVASEMQDMEI